MLKKRSLSPETLNMGDFANLPQPRSLTGCISSQRSYGATRLNLENAETKFLSHEVQNGDTLQRISVKYGVPVERLKRINKIWSNESLFLLKTLKIPYIKQATKWEDESDNEDDVIYEKDDRKQIDNELKTTKTKQEKKVENKTASLENGAEIFEDCSDFLSMIDNRINKCKEDWTKIRSNSQGSAGVPTVSYDSSDANRVFSPTKHYQHFGEKI